LCNVCIFHCIFSFSFIENLFAVKYYAWFKSTPGLLAFFVFLALFYSYYYISLPLFSSWPILPLGNIIYPFSQNIPRKKASNTINLMRPWRLSLSYFAHFFQILEKKIGYVEVVF
jgi:hypothetical protein